MTPFASDRLFPMDLSETDEALVFTAVLPGIRRDDMTILVSEDMLTIEAKRADQTLEETSDLRRAAEQATTLFRKIRLPRSVDIDQIEASFKDDVLTIIIPKLKPTRKQGITIQVG